MITTRARILALVMACVVMFLLVAPTHAQQRGVGNVAITPTPRSEGPGPQRIYGQVAGIFGPAAGPTGLAIQQQQGKADTTRTVTIRLDARTVLRARTAEAQVEGLTVGDFAVVQVNRPGTDVNARRIVFDVDPFGPIRFFSVTGTILRLNRAGTQVLLALPGGAERWIILTVNTRFSIDGSPAGYTPSFQRNNVLTVDVHLTNRGWIAQSVNLRSTRSPAQPH